MPPARGYSAASSASVSAPQSATSPPATHTSIMPPGVPTWAAVALGTRKMPLPIMLPTTMAMADQTPSCRASVRVAGVPDAGGAESRECIGWRDSGQGGIRTHDTREGIPVFETGSFSHSDTCPGQTQLLQGAKFTPLHPAFPVAVGAAAREGERASFRQHGE